jgi:hypothetical protein
MEQQTWVITFKSSLDDVAHEVNSLEDDLLNASSDIEVTQRSRNEYTQGGGVVDLVVTIVTSGAAIAAINAIVAWMKSAYGTSSIEIEIKDMKVRVRNITSKNCEEVLHEVFKNIQDNTEIEKNS